jgi:hypothetical protein
MRILIRDSVGEFVHVGFTEHDGTRVTELLDDIAIFIRDEIRENRGASGGSNAPREEIVFDGYRNAAEEALGATLTNLLFSAAGFGARVVSDDSNERIERRVESFNARERCLHEIGRRDVPFSK